jgi:hypothetical protein
MSKDDCWTGELLGCCVDEPVYTAALASLLYILRRMRLLRIVHSTDLVDDRSIVHRAAGYQDRAPSSIEVWEPPYTIEFLRISLHTLPISASFYHYLRGWTHAKTATMCNCLHSEEVVLMIKADRPRF